jgi:hypothetical protein
MPINITHRFHEDSNLLSSQTGPLGPRFDDTQHERGNTARGDILVVSDRDGDDKAAMAAIRRIACSSAVGEAGELKSGPRTPQLLHEEGSY